MLFPQVGVDFRGKYSWTQRQAVPLIHGVIHFSLSLWQNLSKIEVLEVHGLHLRCGIRDSDCVETAKEKRKGRDAEDCGGEMNPPMLLRSAVEQFSAKSSEGCVLQKKCWTFLKGTFLVQNAAFNSSDVRHLGCVQKMGRINNSFY